MCIFQEFVQAEHFLFITNSFRYQLIEGTMQLSIPMLQTTVIPADQITKIE